MRSVLNLSLNCFSLLLKRDVIAIAAAGAGQPKHSRSRKGSDGGGSGGGGNGGIGQGGHNIIVLSLFCIHHIALLSEKLTESKLIAQTEDREEKPGDG